MKIVTASNGKQTVKMSKSEWTAIGKKAGWMKKADLLDAGPKLDEPTPIKKSTPSIFEELGEQVNKPVINPSADWLSEKEKPAVSKFEMLQKTVKKMIKKNPSLVALDINLSQISDNEFELTAKGHKPVVGNSWKILQTINSIEELGKRHQGIVDTSE